MKNGGPIGLPFFFGLIFPGCNSGNRERKKGLRDKNQGYIWIALLKAGYLPRWEKPPTSVGGFSVGVKSGEPSPNKLYLPWPTVGKV